MLSFTKSYNYRPRIARDLIVVNCAVEFISFLSDLRKTLNATILNFFIIISLLLIFKEAAYFLPFVVKLLDFRDNLSAICSHNL